jgi:TetR/AcrR family transcriptional regulator, mexJK operon transcriptional repressor
MGDKAQLIICAAREAFLEKGYDGVSMDEVASRAGVAKQTVYARYASKDALFLAVVESLQGRMLSAISGAGSLPIRDRLQQIARELLDLVLDPSSLSLSRIALGASYRFPTLGHSIYGARINKLHAILADILEQAAKDGCLAVNNPTVAAEQFLALVRGELHLHCLYDPSFRPSSQDRTADRRRHRLLHGPIWRARGVVRINPDRLGTACERSKAGLS